MKKKRLPYHQEESNTRTGNGFGKLSLEQKVPENFAEPGRRLGPQSSYCPPHECSLLSLIYIEQSQGLQVTPII